jgi:hypothetical protein
VYLKKKCGRNWIEYVDRMRLRNFQKDLKISIERKKKFGKTSEVMELFCCP